MLSDSLPRLTREVADSKGAELIGVWATGVSHLGIAVSSHAWVYLPILVVALILMVPGI